MRLTNGAYIVFSHLCTVRAYTVYHKVHTYKEYHSVYPLVGIGTLPPPLSSSSVPLPLVPKGGGGHTRVRVRGWGSSNFNDWRKAEHSAYSVLCTYVCFSCVGGGPFLPSS